MSACLCEQCAVLSDPKWTQAYRHSCEVDYVVGLSSDEERRSFLASVHDKRGGAAAKRLRASAWALLKGAS